jgi:antitoxin YefM
MVPASGRDWPHRPRLLSLARILYMTTLSLAEARANLSKLVESAVTTHERFEVTRNGYRAAVLMSADDYDALLETVDVLSRPDEVEAIRRGLAEMDAGEVSSADEVRAAMIARGRLTA